MHEVMRRTTGPVVRSVFLSAVALLVGLPCSQAQSLSDASKKADISVYGGFTYAAPDYGDPQDSGVTLGAAYTRYFGWRVYPSLDIRANRYTGQVMNQEAIMGGIRLQTDFKQRFRPYANLYYGNMVIKFNFPISPNYTRDNAGVVGYGGGLDIAVKRNFSARIDFLQEAANFGSNGTQPNNGDFSLAPKAFTVGVVYRIPFKSYVSRH